MKALIFVAFLFTAILNAEEVPPYLKDGRILVMTNSGKVYEFSANEWKVVPRRFGNYEVEDRDDSNHLQYDNEDDNLQAAGPNRIRGIVGVGPTALKRSQDGNVVRVEQDRGMVAGVGYDRQLTRRWSLGVQAFTNHTYTLGVGYDF